MQPTGGLQRRAFLLRGQDWALLFSIAVVIACTALLDPNHVYYYKPEQSVWDNLRSITPLGMLAVGVTVVIIGGGIDLSVASTATFCAMVAIAVMQILGGPSFSDGETTLPVWVTTLGCLASIVTGLMVGTAHAWMVTSLKIPPFIATLGTLVGLRSFARALCNALTAAYKGSRSSQFNIDDPFFSYLYDYVSISLIVLLIASAAVWFILCKSVIGRHLYALGGNEQAARLSGVRTENVKWFMYCTSGVLSAIAGIFYVAFATNINTETLASGKELNAIAAAVVGGCSLQGGVGTVIGTLLGTLFLQAVVDAVYRIVKTDSATYEGLIVGVVVVLAVTISQLRQIRTQGTELLAGMLGIAVIPVLVIFAAALATMTASFQTGLIVGGATLLLLVVMKVLEVQRNART
jgi:ribose/xylose/arabinose/galactoside ABC-type transport system permease subunit